MQSLQTLAAGRVALQGFFHIMEKWSLNNQQSIVLLGGISTSTFYRYKKLPEVTLQNETIDRISYIFGIHKGLCILFPSEERASQWIKRPNDGAPFKGGSALDRMMQGQISDLAAVRRYIDAYAQGGIGNS
jgi:uncharacterized protein (DUF2384 family)